MYHWQPRFEFQHPPGSYEQTLAHPVENDKEVNIGISHEHRFAFYFWGRWIAAYDTVSAGNRPHLVSIDWHRDLALPTEQEQDDLESLDISNSNEMSLFCWGYLNPHNDDHVLAAAYKNMIGDVYVLCKQKFANPSEIIDHLGNKHTVNVYREKEALLENLPDDKPVILDLDLDYFTETDSFMGMDADVELSSDQQIYSLLDPDSDFLGKIYQNLFGFTIALEPKFCGGYQNSCSLFKKVDQQLFNPPLLHPAGDWKKTDNEKR